MIRLIGTKRAVVLGAVLALNLIVGGAYVFVVEPMREDEEQRLKTAQSSISKLSSDTQSIKNSLEAFPANYAQYQALSAKGFLKAQDRFEAGRVLDAVRAKQNWLIGYSYKIDAIKPIPSIPASAAKMRLIDSRVTIEHVSSVLDMSVYRLMHDLAAEFPQHMRMDGFEIKKVKVLDEGTLQELTRRQVALVDGTVTFDWLTVVPEEAPATAPGQSGGFRGR